MSFREFLKIVFIIALLAFSSVFPFILSFMALGQTLLIILLISAITILMYKYKDKSIGLTDALRNFLKEPPRKGLKKIYRYLSIWIFLSVLFQISWVFDSVRDAGILVLTSDYSKGLLWHHILTFILSILFLFLLPLLYINFLFKPKEKPAHNKPFPRKVLIFALSLPSGEPLEQIQSLRERLQQLGNQVLPKEETLKDLPGNWTPALRAIIHENHVLKRVIVILSEKAKEHFANFEKFLKVIPHLEKRITTGDLIIEKSRVVDVSDFRDVKIELDRLLQNLKNYEDSDISFNITGGTAMVSSAMILEAVVGDRQAEYVRQSGDKSLVRIDVTERDIPLID